jgi:hypothetical protein
MKGPLFLFLLVSFSAIAQNKNVLQIINDVNNKNLSPEVEKECCGADLDTPSVINQCAIELCGKPTADNYFIINDENFEKYAKPDALKRYGEIESEVKELVQREIKSNSELVTALKGQLNGQKLKIDFKEWDNDAYDTLAEKFFDQYIDISINKSKKLADRITYKILLPSGASEVMKAALNNYASRLKFLALKKTSEGLKVGLYSNAEIQELMKSEWASFYKVYSEKLKANPEFMKPYQSFVETTKNNIETKIDGPTKYSEVFAYIDLFRNQYVTETTQTEPPSLNRCMDKACQKGIQEYLGKVNFKERLDSLTEENSSKDLVDDKLLSCRSELASKNLLDDDLEKVAMMYKDVKARLLSKTAANFSDHSKAELSKYYDQIHISLKSGSDNEDKFINDIHKVYNTSKDEEEESDQKALILKLFEKSDYNGDVDPMGGTTYCTSLFATVWDAFAPKGDFSLEDASDADLAKDNLFLSKFSCTHVVAGKQVLAHELGHAMSNAFIQKKLSEQSLKDFLKLRTCANSHYKKPSVMSPDPNFMFPGDSFRTEEDTADLISYLAYADVGLMECALLDRNAKGTAYTDLSVKNSMEADPHSSSMFRVLQEAVHKKKELPSSCKKVIEQNKDIGFNLCF